MGLTTDYRLGELETQILHCIWQRDEVTVREVWSEVQQTRPLAYTTIMTVMQRLVTKGVLSARRQGKTDYYRALVQPDELVTVRAQAAVRDVLANFGDAALAQFLRELDTLDPERLAALRDMTKQEPPNAT